MRRKMENNLRVFGKMRVGVELGKSGYVEIEKTPRQAMRK
jgi:hypothetical protein